VNKENKEAKQPRSQLLKYICLIALSMAMGMLLGRLRLMPEKEKDQRIAGAADVIYFEDVLGYDGYAVTEKTALFPPYTVYYAEKLFRSFPIARSWGLRDDHIADIDHDGENELICNVMFGDGHEETVVYRREGKTILYGYACSMLDEPYDDWGTGSRCCRYLPEEQVVEIFYWNNDKQDYLSRKYPIDYGSFDSWKDAAELFTEEE